VKIVDHLHPGNASAGGTPPSSPPPTSTTSPPSPSPSTSTLITGGHPQFSVTGVSAVTAAIPGVNNKWDPNFYVNNGDSNGPDWALIRLSLGGRPVPFGPYSNVDCAPDAGGQRCLLSSTPGGWLFTATVSGPQGTPFTITVRLVGAAMQAGRVVATAHGTLGQ
jgi:hypothetical protein